MALIGGAVFSGGQYAENREAIVAAFEQGPSLFTGATTNYALTNLTPVQKAVFGGTPGPGSSRPRT